MQRSFKTRGSRIDASLPVALRFGHVKEEGRPASAAQTMAERDERHIARLKRHLLLCTVRKMLNTLRTDAANP